MYYRRNEAECLKAIGVHKEQAQESSSRPGRSRSRWSLHHSDGVQKANDKVLIASLIPDADLFRLVPEPGPSDWLANHEEPGQSFDDFLHCNANVPTAERNVIYIASLTFTDTSPGAGAAAAANGAPNPAVNQAHSNATAPTLGRVHPMGGGRRGALATGSFLGTGTNGADLEPSPDRVVYEVPSNVIALLAEYASFFFNLPVKVLHIGSIGASGRIRTRIHQGTHRLQAHAGDILRELALHLPRNAFTLGAITTVDLYPRESWNFVFGLADLRGRVGVYSLARYLPDFFMGIPTARPGYPNATGRHPAQNGIPSPSSSPQSVRKSQPPPPAPSGQGQQVDPMLLMRACRLMAHEFSHTFGLLHCVYFHCLMNGSNHFEESDRRPVFLCPVCLRKLHHSCHFDVLDRYRRMRQFWMRAGMQHEARWLEQRIAKIERFAGITSGTAAATDSTSNLSAMQMPLPDGGGISIALVGHPRNLRTSTEDAKTISETHMAEDPQSQSEKIEKNPDSLTPPHAAGLMPFPSSMTSTSTFSSLAAHSPITSKGPLSPQKSQKSPTRPQTASGSTLRSPTSRNHQQVQHFESHVSPSTRAAPALSPSKHAVPENVGNVRGHTQTCVLERSSGPDWSRGQLRVLNEEAQIARAQGTGPGLGSEWDIQAFNANVEITRQHSQSQRMHSQTREHADTWNLMSQHGQHGYQGPQNSQHSSSNFSVSSSTSSSNGNPFSEFMLPTSNTDSRELLPTNLRLRDCPGNFVAGHVHVQPHMSSHMFGQNVHIRAADGADFMHEAAQAQAQARVYNTNHSESLTNRSRALGQHHLDFDSLEAIPSTISVSSSLVSPSRENYRTSFPITQSFSYTTSTAPSDSNAGNVRSNASQTFGSNIIGLHFPSSSPTYRY